MSNQPIDTAIKEAELRKLELEANVLSLNWWKKPSYMASIATILIAVIGVFKAYTDGTLDNLRIKKESLEREKQRLELQVIGLKIDTMQLKKEAEALTKKIATLQECSNTLIEQVAVYRQAVINSEAFASGLFTLPLEKLIYHKMTFEENQPLFNALDEFLDALPAIRNDLNENAHKLIHMDAASCASD